MVITVIIALGIGFGAGAFTSPKQNQQQRMQTQKVDSSKPSNTRELTEEQKSELLYIIEEEKLARDVYTVLYNTWGTKKFYNILNAEENHQNKVAMLLTTYGMPNPTTDNDIGVFKNTELQELYNALIIQWKKSQVDAIQVGILIETTDIADLEKMMPMFSWYNDITQTLEALLASSKRHLAAFQK
jgi:hypothetical protein